MQNGLPIITVFLLFVLMPILLAERFGNQTSNEAEKKQYWIKETKSVPLTIANAIGGTIGLTGNILVLITIIKTKQLHNPSLYLVVNLAVTDIINSFITITGESILRDLKLPKNNFGAFLCHFWESEYIMGTAIIVTAFTIVTIALDRYLAVAKAIFYRNNFNGRLVAKIVLVIWIVAALYCQYLVWIIRFDYDTGECTIMDTSEYNWIGHEIFWIILVFHIPFIMTLALYLSAFLKMKEKLKSNLTSSQKSQIMIMNKLSKFGVVVTVSYMLTVGVGLNMYLMSYIPGAWPTYHSDGGMSVTIFLFSINSWTNPVIYSLSNKNFRHGLLNIVSCGKQPVLVHSITSENRYNNGSRDAPATGPHSKSDV